MRRTIQLGALAAMGTLVGCDAAAIEETSSALTEDQQVCCTADGCEVDRRGDQECADGVQWQCNSSECLAKLDDERWASMSHLDAYYLGRGTASGAIDPFDPYDPWYMDPDCAEFLRNELGTKCHEIGGVGGGGGGGGGGGHGGELDCTTCTLTFVYDVGVCTAVPTLLGKAVCLYKAQDKYVECARDECDDVQTSPPCPWDPPNPLALLCP